MDETTLWSCFASTNLDAPAGSKDEVSTAKQLRKCHHAIAHLLGCCDDKDPGWSQRRTCRMRAEAESRDGSAGHSQSSEAEPDLAAGAAVEPRCSTGTNSNETPKVAEWKASRPLFRDCNYGGSFCELLAVEAVQEYLTFHGLQDTQKALVSSQCPAMLGKAFLGITVPSLVPSLAPLHGPGDVAVQAELAVMKALQDFDDGKREPFLQQWKSLVPSNSPSGGSLELRVRVYFGTYKTRKALLANDPETPLLEPDFSDLKAFLSSRPSAMGSDPSSNSLSSLYALPFVPQPHQNSALRFIFKEPWSQQLRSDLQAFMTAYTGTRHAPSLRHLADGMIQARCPMTSPPPASWQELLRLAEIGFSASSYALAKLQTFGSCPAPQSLERDDRQDDELLDWLGSGGKMLPELLKQVADLRKRLGAVARHPTDEPPSVQETPGSMRPSMQSLLRAQSVDWEPQGVSTPVPLLQDRLWPREALRGSSASSLNASNSNAGAVRRLHSARSIESRSRSATALLPVPPALDFGRIAALLGDATEDAAAPPMLSVLRAVLRQNGSSVYSETVASGHPNWPWCGARRRAPYDAWCFARMQRPVVVAGKPCGTDLDEVAKRPTSKQILERLKSSKTPWQSIAELLNGVKHVNLVIPTAGIAAYGRSKLWQHALLLFFRLSEALRLDSVAISSAVSACERSNQWTLALWTLGRSDAQRGLTSAAVACGQRGEWIWSLQLSQQPGTSFQCLTASLTACEKACRWSSALELGRWMMDGRIQVDHLAMNGILNACASARQWQTCIVQSEMATKDAVMSNILSNACAGEWAWPKSLAFLQNEQLRGGGGRSLPGFSAVMQSLRWWTAVSLCMTGRQLRQMISEELPCKPGTHISVQHGSSPLSLDQTLRQQGLGECVTLSYVYVPVDILAAWKYLQGEHVEDEEFALHGLTRIEGVKSARQLLQLPSSLQHLKLDRNFNESIAQVSFPNGIKTMIFGDAFRATLHGMTLPAGLQTLTFGQCFNQSLDGVSLPAGLQTLTFGKCFNQSLDGVSLPAGLQTLTFGPYFNQRLDNATLPAGLQTLTFGRRFNQSLEGVSLPAGLQTLTFAELFNQSLDGVTLPAGLQTLTLGSDFNQSLDGVSLPAGLQTLTLGRCFNQSLDGVSLPAGLHTLTFGRCFNQSLDGVSLPAAGLQTLSFANYFNQRLDGVSLPAGLQTMTFGDSFNQNLDGVSLPAGLQTLTFGRCFNQSLDGATLPAGLQTLTFGSGLNPSLDGVPLPAGLQTLTLGWEFNQSLDGVSLPAGLQTLALGSDFNPSAYLDFRPMLQPKLGWRVSASSLQTLTLGSDFNQRLDGATLPAGLQTLTLGSDFNPFTGRFNRSLDGVSLPAGLQTLTLGWDFNQSLDGDFLKTFRTSDVEVDAISCCSFQKTLESAGDWRRSLDALEQNDQQQLVPDALLYNTLVSSSEKSSTWTASLSLCALRAAQFGPDASSASATALDLLKSLEANVPPSSHALAALLGEVAEVPDVEVTVFSMLAHATVDGVAPPPGLLATLQSALLAAAAYRHPGVDAPVQRLFTTTTTSNRQGLYRYTKELRLLRHILRCAHATPSEVCRAIESFGASRTKRWLKVAGTQKAKVLETVVAGLGLQPRTEILEIGTYCGYSALRMLLALQGGPGQSHLHIDSLEADAVHAVVACNVLQVAGVSSDRIRIHIGHSKSLLPSWPTSAQFSAVFMDQRGSRYEEDLDVLEHRQLLAPGAAIIADNVLKPGAPRFLWKLVEGSRRHRQDHSEYHVQILSLQEFAMPSEDWMTVSIRTSLLEASGCSEEVPEKILELHHLAEAMRDLASKPGGTSVSFEEWRNFASKMKEELKRLGIQATAEVEPP
eukprot:s56_g20.t1